MKKKVFDEERPFIVVAVIVIMFLIALYAQDLQAQVTIGSGIVPGKYSLLDLKENKEGTTTKGLHMPRLKTSQRDDLTAKKTDSQEAKGLVIYNTDNNCLEYWNGVKWVSLCLGTANITLTPDDPFCVYDPNDMDPATGTADYCTYTPTDDPACVVPSGQAYLVSLTAGAAYAVLQVDEVTSAFTVSFTPNNSSRERIAVVRVVNNCSGEFQDFVFRQEGATCPTAITPVVEMQTTTLCSGSNIHAYVKNPQTGIDYIWEYGGVIINTGVSMTITRAGSYRVYAGLQGCGTPASFSITEDNTAVAPAAATLLASNSGILCPGGEVVLSADINQTGVAIDWYLDNVKQASNANPLRLNTSLATQAGEWIAIVRNTTSGCISAPSNKVNLVYQSTGTKLADPVATVNSVSLGSALTICKGSSLALAVTNAAVYPAGTTYEWFDNGVSIHKSADPLYYYTVPQSKENIILSVQVNNNDGSCPSTVVPNASTNVTFPVPATTVINSGNASTAICGITPATLQASQSGGAEYNWFFNNALITAPDANNASVNTFTYKASNQGNYGVRYKDAAGCWSTISSTINVRQSAAVDISWVNEPVDVIEGDTKTYSVNASPTPDSYEWTSSDLSRAIVVAIDNGRSAVVNYPNGKTGKVTITVKASNECGTVNKSKEIDVKPGCTPVTSATLTPDNAKPVNKVLNTSGAYKTTGDAKTDFSVSANNGSTPYTYKWYVNGAEQSGKTGTTFSFTTPTTVTSSANYLVTAKVFNACTTAGLETAATTVHVIRDYETDNSNTYRISGRICYDIKQGNFNDDCAPAAARKDNVTENALSGSERTHEYEFINYAPYNGLFWEVLDDASLVESLTYNGTKVQVKFKPTASMNAVKGTTKTTAYKLTLIAKFLNAANGGTAKQVELPISIQDCSCGCPIKSASGNGYITMMCYNLGADPATQYLSPQEQANYSGTAANISGDLYQWGRMADGHQKRSSGTTGTQATSFDSNGQVSSSAAQYGKFIITTSTDDFDWRNTQKNDLWNSGTEQAPVKTPSDPCPLGWRVPTSTEWTSIKNSNNSASASTGSVTGALITPSGSSKPTLFLPGGGFRRNTSGAIESTALLYWSSTPRTTGTGAANIDIPATVAVVGANSDPRAFGFSVRCISMD